MDIRAVDGTPLGPFFRFRRLGWIGRLRGIRGFGWIGRFRRRLLHDQFKDRGIHRVAAANGCVPIPACKAVAAGFIVRLYRRFRLGQRLAEFVLAGTQYGTIIVLERNGCLDDIQLEADSKAFKLCLYGNGADLFITEANQILTVNGHGLDGTVAVGGHHQAARHIQMLPHLHIIRLGRAGYQLQRDDGGLRLHRLGGHFRSLVQLDIGHGDPAVILHAAPLIVVRRNDFINIDPVTGILLAHHIKGQAGAGAAVDIICRNGAADIFRFRRFCGFLGFLRLRKRGHVHDLSCIGIPPLGVNRGTTGKAAVQHLDLRSANLSSIPAGKFVNERIAIFINAGRNIRKIKYGCGRIRGVIAIDLVTAGATVAVHKNMLIILRNAVGGVIRFIDSVYVHIGFAKAALDQGVLTAGGAPQAHAKQQFITHIAADHSGAEVAANGIDPVGAAVIGEGNQSVKLTLSKIQRVLLGEFVHRAFEISQFRMEQLQRFLFCNIIV